MTKALAEEGVGLVMSVGAEGFGQEECMTTSPTTNPTSCPSQEPRGSWMSMESQWGRLFVAHKVCKFAGKTQEKNRFSILNRGKQKQKSSSILL